MIFLLGGTPWNNLQRGQRGTKRGRWSMLVVPNLPFGNRARGAHGGSGDFAYRRDFFRPHPPHPGPFLLAFLHGVVPENLRPCLARLYRAMPMILGHASSWLLVHFPRTSFFCVRECLLGCLCTREKRDNSSAPPVAGELRTIFTRGL